jgi:diguanylate cyclase (GGDEF)-like protein
MPGAADQPDHEETGPGQGSSAAPRAATGPGQASSGNTEQRAAVVLLLNHNRDPLAAQVEAMVRAGFEVREADSLAQSCRLLAQVRPDIVILNPLVLCAGGVELEMLEGLQKEEEPVPVLLMVNDLGTLAEARSLKVAFRDFLLKPYTPAECAHRVELALLARRKFQRLQARNRQLEGQVSVDFKTGLISELYFRRILGLEWKRAQRHQNPLSLLLLDVDDFKRINDSTEYVFGDEVLKRVAESLRGTIRETDFAARCGGDEFCVLLPQTSPAEAVQTALRIRQRISAMTVANHGYAQQVTVSIGLDTFDGRSAMTVDALRRNANQALKEAKRRGKNQVWLYAGREHAAPAVTESDATVIPAPEAGNATAPRSDRPPPDASPLPGGAQSGL